MIKKLIVILPFLLVVSCYSAEIKGRDYDGNTPLHYAVLEQNTCLVKEFIREGADVNAANNYGLTPLQCAAVINNPGIMHMLISGGANTNYTVHGNRDTAEEVPESIARFPEDRLNFFLTFDAGSDDTNLGYILDTLRSYRIVATFFVTGQFMERYPGGLRRIVMEGHIVGNHTYSHSPEYDEKKLLDELIRTEKIYRKVTGRKMKKIWRAPYLGNRSRPWMINAAWKIGYRHIDVSVYSRDWVGPGTAGYVSNDRFMKLFRSGLERNLSGYRGGIMLMHAGAYREGDRDFVYTLDDIIRCLLRSGYVFDNCSRFG